MIAQLRAAKAPCTLGRGDAFDNYAYYGIKESVLVDPSTMLGMTVGGHIGAHAKRPNGQARPLLGASIMICSTAYFGRSASATSLTLRSP